MPLPRSRSSLSWVASFIARAGLVLFLLAGAGCREARFEPDGTDVYTVGTASSDGTGKVYHGREIARVRGHRDASWFDRPDRAIEELPSRVIQAMSLAPDAAVADIGTGTGYFALRIAPHVPEGRVYAVDIQEEMLEIVNERAEALGLRNVVPVLGGIDDPRLPPASLDAALIVDAYHEFSHPYEMMQGLVAALKPGGRLYLVEYRAEDPTIPVDPLHKMTETQARQEMEAAGLVWQETKDILPQQHFMVFEKQ